MLGLCLLVRRGSSVARRETSYTRFSDERRHRFIEVPVEADEETRVWYARNPRRCEDCSPRVRGQGQEGVRTGILNENVFETVPLDV